MSKNWQDSFKNDILDFLTSREKLHKEYKKSLGDIYPKDLANIMANYLVDEIGRINQYCIECRGPLDEPLPCGHLYHRSCILNYPSDKCLYCNASIEDLTPSEKKLLVKRIKEEIQEQDYYDNLDNNDNYYSIRNEYVRMLEKYQ